MPPRLTDKERALRALPEVPFMRQIMREAERFGWLVSHTHDSRLSEPGLPDILMVRGSRLLAIECKKRGPKGVVTAAQQQWLDALSQVPGIEAMVLRPGDDWAQFLV